MLRALCLTGLAVTVTATGAGHGSAHATAPKAEPAAVTVATCAGRPVVADTLPAGSCVVIRAGGFAARESVRIRQFSASRVAATAVADAHGIVTCRLRVASRHRMSDVLTLVGLGAVRPAARTGSVTVSVPRFAILRYRIR